MKVLIVCNNAFVKGNGLHTAVHMLITNLKARGIETALLTTANDNRNGVQAEFPLRHFRIPFFEPLVYKNGFRFACVEKDVIRRAVEWAEIVHIQECFPLEDATIAIAREMGKPVVGSFHLFPQNVISNLVDVSGENLLNRLLMKYWASILRKCSIIHSPSRCGADFLVRSGIRNEIRVFSNGIKVKVPQDTACSSWTGCTESDVIHILSIGRNAREKDQITLLKAMYYSKYADRIKLTIAGKGQLRKMLERKSSRMMREGVLRHSPVFGFYNKEQLAALSRFSYLYIHTAWVEIEGLSCLETLREGIVPVIAEGPYTATSQFALCEQSLFPAKDAKALAERIDWWIEHREEHDRMKAEYAASAMSYDDKSSTDAMIAMYRDAIAKA